MNYPPNWGYPQQPVYFVPPTKTGMTIEDILAAENQLKMLKDAFKKEADDNKKKDDKEKKGPKAPTFSLGAVFGILSIGSIPFVLMQLAILDWARTGIAAFLKVPTP